MEFVLEHSWTIVAIFGLAATASTTFFLRGGGTPPLIATIVCILAALGLAVLASVVSTPNQLVRAELDRVVEAFKDGDETAVLASFANDYSDGARNRADIERLVRQHMSRARLSDIWLSGVTLAPAPQARRTARFVAHVVGDYQGQSTGPDSYPVRMEIDFTLVGADWKIVAIRRYDPIRSAEQIPLDRIP